MFASVLRSPDAVDGGTAAATGKGASATELPLGGENGLWPDLRIGHKALLGYGPLSDGMVRQMMADVCQFLRQVVLITSNVVETVGIGQVRKILAAEVPIPRGIILEDGTLNIGARAAESDKATSEQAERDHRKNPRGRRHPLIAFLMLGVQASRLIMTITQGTNPTAHDREPVQARLDREAQDKYDRERAREPYNS